MQDGVNWLLDPEEAQEFWLDQQTLHIVQEAWGPFKSHNMHDLCHFNKDGTPIKNWVGTSQPQLIKKCPEGSNFVQLMRTEIKKALCKHMRKDKKHHAHEPDSNSDSNNSTWRGGSDSIGEANISKHVN